MKKAIWATLALVGLVSLMAGTAGSTEDHKITICHRTNANNNPYVQITVDTHAVDGEGGADHYGKHQGPVWDPTLKADHVKWGDIIPPVDGVHNGLNWDTAGQAIYNNGCKPAVVEEPTTTTTVQDKNPEETETIPPVVIEREPLPLIKEYPEADMPITG